MNKILPIMPSKGLSNRDRSIFTVHGVHVVEAAAAISVVYYSVIEDLSQ